MRPSAYDGLIRDVYLAGKRGPLRVAVSEGSHPPFLLAGDVALLERGGLGPTRPGEFIGVRGADPGASVRLVRYLGRKGERVRGLLPSEVESFPAGDVLGRVTGVERDGQVLPVAAAAGKARLEALALAARARGARHQVQLRRDHASLYWDLVEAFESGVSETGDLLITERCGVGCRFCIYSCVTTGAEMEPELVARAAASFRAAGVPRIRILGGEPFLNLPHLVQCFAAARRHYPAEDIAILTSGYFAGSDETTRARMDPLVAAGLGEIHLSFDVFHLERYPLACYERLLEYSSERGLRTVLVVHYSAALAPELETLLRLRRRFPFAVRISVVSREGDAVRLAESETSLAGFDGFRAGLLAEPGVTLVSEDRSCFRWTVFPRGEVRFCCKENERNVVGDLTRDSLAVLQGRLRDLAGRNRMNVLAYAACPSPESSANACLRCPLEARRH